MKTFQLLFLSFCLFVSCSAVDEKCPSTPIKPCTCKTYFDGACIITCSLASQADIDRIAEIPNLCDGNVHFVLVHSKVDGIPAKLWKQLLSSSTIDVTIKHSAIQGLIPSGGESIPKTSSPGEAIIKIAHAKVEKWDWKQLGNMYSDGELTVVIDDTTLEALDADFTKIAGGQVHKVTIDDADLSSILEDQFAPFDDLNSLSLQNNKLTSVSRSMVAKPAKNLQFFHLNGNLLTTLPSDLFSDMPKLEIVYLRNNNLKSLSQELFQAISSPRLHQIDLVNNPWECDCSLVQVIRNTKQILNMGVCASPESLAKKKVRDLPSLLNC